MFTPRSLEAIQADLSIVLLSPWTDPFFQELQQLKDQLQAKGYIGAHTVAEVAEIPGPGGILRKSLEAIRRADLAVFIFFRPDRTIHRLTEVNQGVTIELVSALYSQGKSVHEILVAVERGTLALSSGLLESLFKNHGIEHEEFRGAKDLERIVSAFCYDHAIKRLYFGTDTTV